MIRPLDILDSAVRLTDSVLIGVSCGKDSLALLELCRDRFSRIAGFFEYLVPGLEFQERYLRYLERRYLITIHRLPHFQLGQMMQAASFRPHTKASLAAPTLSIKDILAEARRLSGIEWAVTGEKKVDSLQHRGMLSKCHGIDIDARRCYPLADWSNASIYNFLKTRRIPLPPDYLMFGRSFGRLYGEELTAIRDRFPDDYRKILAVFPYAQAAVKREEIRRRASSDAVSEVHG